MTGTAHPSGPAPPLRIGMLTPLSTGPLLPLLDDGPGDLAAGIGGPGPTDLIAALARAGHHVSAASLDPTITRPQRATGPRVDLVLLPMRPRHRGRDAYRPERAALRHVLAGWDVDVVNAHWTYEYALVARHAAVPQLVTVRDWSPAVVRYNPIPYWVVKAAMNAVVLAARPPLTTPSPSVARRLRRVGQHGVRLIPNGLPAALMDPAPRTRPQDPPRLLCVANEFSGRKNTTTLLEAFRIVRTALPAATLRLVGADHGPGERAQRWARSRNLLPGTVFLGQLSRPEVQEELHAADLLVHPAREEPFGIAVIEALARGLPVIAGDRSGGPPYILDRGRVGPLVDVDRPDDIAAAVLRLLRDPARWAASSAAGLERVRTTFDIDRIAEQYVQAYRDVLAGRW